MRRSRRRGAAVAEMAVILVLFISMLFAVIEFGRVFMVRHLMTNAARQEDRMALAGTYTHATNEIETEVRRVLVTMKPSNVQVSIFRTDDAGEPDGVWTDAAFGEGIAVKVVADIHPFLPTFGIVPDHMRITVLTIQRSEGD